MDGVSEEAGGHQKGSSGPQDEAAEDRGESSVFFKRCWCALYSLGRNEASNPPSAQQLLAARSGYRINKKIARPHPEEAGDEGLPPGEDVVVTQNRPADDRRIFVYATTKKGQEESVLFLFQSSGNLLANGFGNARLINVPG